MLYNRFYNQPHNKRIKNEYIIHIYFFLFAALNRMTTQLNNHLVSIHSTEKGPQRNFIGKTPFQKFNSQEMHSYNNGLVDSNMTALISLQNSNGSFTCNSENWTNSVFEYYLGSLQQVSEKFPKHLIFDSHDDNNSTNSEIWTTALAIKIMEIKMKDSIDTWDLVAKKAKYSLKQRCKDNLDSYHELLKEAENVVNKGNFLF